MQPFEERQQSYRARNEHMAMYAGRCWCGHGEKVRSSDGTDGAHSLIRGPHDPDCEPECVAFHYHQHCRECAKAPAKDACCTPTPVPET